jgi:hypothetical protein
MSIVSELATMKALADEITGNKPYAPYGRCETCGTELEYEKPWHGTFDQPASTGGFYCSECEKWS